MINVTIPNLPKFQKALKKYPQLAEKEIKDALTKSLYQIVRETKPITPVKTGRLRNSIGEVGSEGIFKVEKMRGTIGTNVQYAVYVHGKKPFLLQGTQKALGAIKGFFKDAMDNVFNKIASDSN